MQVPIFSGFAAPAIAQRLQDARGEGAVHGRRAFVRRGRELPMKAIARRGPAATRRRSSTSSSRSAPMTRPSWDVELGPGELPPLEVDSETPYLLDLHVRARPAGRRASSTSRAASSSRSRARSPTRPTSIPATSMLFATDMGWIMGPWTVVGGGALRLRRSSSLEGAPDWPADRLWQLVEEEHVTLLGFSPTLVRALIPHGEPEPQISPRCALSSRRASRGTPSPYRWLSSTSAAAAARSSTARAGRRSARASCRRRQSSRSRRARSAGLRSAWRWTSSTTTGRPCAARSASSSAASRCRG